MSKAISEYTRKRNFDITSEPAEAPAGKAAKQSKTALRFVIQKHDARNLHYDFRLELEGTLKSWAVPKGPSLDPSQKRLAVHVEDHPLGYASFEGSIPAGQYGAGDVIVWDQGIWQPHDEPEAAYQAGKLKFTLVGEKLSGEWTLVKTRLKVSGDKDKLEAYTKRTLAKFQEKYLVALQECKAKLKEKQDKIEALENRSSAEKTAQKREERLLSSTVYELGLAIMQNRLKER